MKKTVLASAMLLAFAGLANAAVDVYTEDTSIVIKEKRIWATDYTILGDREPAPGKIFVNLDFGTQNVNVDCVGIGLDTRNGYRGAEFDILTKGNVYIAGETAAFVNTTGNSIQAKEIELFARSANAIGLYGELTLNADRVSIKSNSTGSNAIQVSAGSTLTIDADSVVVNSGRTAVRGASNTNIKIIANTMELSTTNETRAALESDSNVELDVDNATFNGSLIVGGELNATGNLTLNDDGNEINTLTGKDLTFTIGATAVANTPVLRSAATADNNTPVLTITNNDAENLKIAADGSMSIDALAEAVAIANGAEGVQLSVGETAVFGAVTGTLDADGQLANVEQAINTKTEALADKIWLAPNMLNRIMMNDVRKRMGDLRAAEGTHGVWARYNGGQMSGTGVDVDFNMVQVGIDTVPVVDAPRFGVAFSYAQSEAKDGMGTADMDAFSLAFYGTKFYDNGMFVDVIGRMATMDTDLVNDGYKGKMDNVALSLSGELGWRFDVTDRFFFEPSVEATYTYTNADKFTMSNGGTYELEAMDSLVGRAGFAAGFKCPANKGDIYVRAAVVHEFMGDATINSWVGNTAATPIESDGKDTWFEYAIGAQFNVNKNTYVYADVERTEGATLDEDWRANVGVRFAF